MRIFIFLIMAFVLLLSTNGQAWENTVTHKTISINAAKLRFEPDFLDSDVKGKSASEWIQDGSELEDSGTLYQFTNGTARSLNHFHAPNGPLSQAGLTDLKNGISAVLWAQKGPYQVSKGWGDWSWQKVQDHYYNYLTATSKASAEENLSKVLLGLGYQMHLIQDMSQPNHVRNDTHIFDGAGWISGLETWAKENDANVIRPLAQTPIIPAVDLTQSFDDPALSPVARLSDTRAYFATQSPSESLSQGLAEYTNANFFSEDTAFSSYRYSPDHKHYFPYPRKETTNIQDYIDNLIPAETIMGEDGEIQKGIWIRKLGTDGVNHLARAGASSRFWLTLFGEGKAFYQSFDVDEICFKDYSEKLIPRAVGYSKAMLEYFYRGRVELKLPDPPNERFSNIRLKARNNTSTGEEMTSPEEIKLVVKYKQMKEDPAQGKIVKDGDEYHYLVVPVKNAVSAIPKDTPVELEFDLSASPLPIWAYDVTLQVVFKGKLGNETGSVAVGLTRLPSVGGDIDLALPDKGIYGITTPSGAFSEFRVKAANVSISDDTMSDGNIELIAWYKQADQDPFLDQPSDKSPLDHASYYIRVPEKNGVHSIPLGSSAELVFDLSQNPLPLWATDLRVYVVYTGQVGAKANEVAVGFRDIAEPTPIDIVNNMDHVCLNGSYLMAGSQEAINAVGTNAAGRPNWDIYPHRLKDVYLAFSSSPASAAGYSAKFPIIQPGEYGRVFVLSDYEFNFSSSVTAENIFGPLQDVWGLAFGSSVDPIEGVLNQLVYEDGEYFDYYPGLNAERALLSWWVTHYENPEWPAGSTCDSSGATPGLAGPAAVEFPQ